MTRHEDHEFESLDDLRITIDPEASEEEIEKFIDDLALAIAAAARRIVAEGKRTEGKPPTIDY